MPHAQAALLESEDSEDEDPQRVEVDTTEIARVRERARDREKVREEERQ